MSRGLGAALLLCLAGAVLLLAGAGATWTTAVVAARAPLPGATVDVTGADLVPGLRALGLLGLAGVPALLAVRRWGRVAVGVLLAAAGALAGVLVVRVLADHERHVRAAGVLDRAAGGASATSPTVWAFAAAAGGVLLALAGLLAVLRGRSWPVLGARYETPSARPAPAAPAGDKQVWDALDRGEDPTR